MILVILSLFVSGSFSVLQPEILTEWGVSGMESLQTLWVGGRNAGHLIEGSPKSFISRAPENELPQCRFRALNYGTLAVTHTAH